MKSFKLLILIVLVFLFSRIGYSYNIEQGYNIDRTDFTEFIDIDSLLHTDISRESLPEDSEIEDILRYIDIGKELSPESQQGESFLGHTEIRDKKGGRDFDFYLDIRRVPLPDSLRDKSKESEGVMVFKCWNETGDCEPLVDVILIREDIMPLLIANNITLGLAILGAVTTYPLVMGAIRAGLTGGKLVATLGGGALMKLSGSVVAPIVTKKIFSKGGIVILGMTVGGAVALSLDLHYGSTLRKLLSKKDILLVGRLDKAEKKMTKILEAIADRREIQEARRKRKQQKKGERR